MKPIDFPDLLHLGTFAYASLGFVASLLVISFILTRKYLALIGPSSPAPEKALRQFPNSLLLWFFVTFFVGFVCFSAANLLWGLGSAIPSVIAVALYVVFALILILEFLAIVFYYATDLNEDVSLALLSFEVIALAAFFSRGLVLFLFEGAFGTFNLFMIAVVLIIQVAQTTDTAKKLADLSFMELLRTPKKTIIEIVKQTQASKTIKKN